MPEQKSSAVVHRSKQKPGVSVVQLKGKLIGAKARKDRVIKRTDTAPRG